MIPQHVRCEKCHYVFLNEEYLKIIEKVHFEDDPKCPNCKQEAMFSMVCQQEGCRNPWIGMFQFPDGSKKCVCLNHEP